MVGTDPELGAGAGQQAIHHGIGQALLGAVAARAAGARGQAVEAGRSAYPRGGRISFAFKLQRPHPAAHGRKAPHDAPGHGVDHPQAFVGADPQQPPAPGQRVAVQVAGLGRSRRSANSRVTRVRGSCVNKPS